MKNSDNILTVKQAKQEISRILFDQCNQKSEEIKAEFLRKEAKRSHEYMEKKIKKALEDLPLCHGKKMIVGFFNGDPNLPIVYRCSICHQSILSSKRE